VLHSGGVRCVGPCQRHQREVAGDQVDSEQVEDDKPGWEEHLRDDRRDALSDREERGAGCNGEQGSAQNLASFRGKSRVQQHQIVYEALKAEMGGRLHALALQTGAPER
jgi:hypothetical protein